MHHTLKFYGEHRDWIVRLYMFFGSWTRIPLVGHLVRWVGNKYGGLHSACLLTPAEAEELVTIAEGVAVAPCTCRKLFHNCDNPIDVEILVGPSRHVSLEAMAKDTRVIAKEKAIEILRDSHRRGLIFTLAKCRGDYYAICSCCNCCCVPLRLNKLYGIGNAVHRHEDIVGEFREYQAGYR